MRRRLVRTEDGQVTVLVVGMLIVLMAVCGVAVDGTRAFLERRALQNIADSAALAAADELDVVSFYSEGGESLSLDATAARTTALEMVAAAGRDARAAIVADAGAVEVTLSGQVETQFLRLVGFEVLPVIVVARAEPQVGAIPGSGPPEIPAPAGP